MSTAFCEYASQLCFKTRTIILCNNCTHFTCMLPLTSTVAFYCLHRNHLHQVTTTSFSFAFAVGDEAQGVSGALCTLEVEMSQSCRPHAKGLRTMQGMQGVLREMVCGWKRVRGAVVTLRRCCWETSAACMMTQKRQRKRHLT